MSSSIFKSGDTVMLISCSKPLTVLEVDKKEVSLCWWDEYKQQICRDTVHQNALQFAPTAPTVSASMATSLCKAAPFSKTGFLLINTDE